MMIMMMPPLLPSLKEIDRTNSQNTTCSRKLGGKGNPAGSAPQGFSFPTSTEHCLPQRGSASQDGLGGHVHQKEGTQSHPQEGRRLT